MHEPHAILVLLRSPDGKYLTGHKNAWSFTADRTQARVFDYVGDHVPEEITRLGKERDLLLTAEAADPRERYELCDGCGQRIMAFKAFYDGQHYLCSECRKQ